MRGSSPETDRRLRNSPNSPEPRSDRREEIDRPVAMLVSVRLVTSPATGIRMPQSAVALEASCSDRREEIDRPAAFSQAFKPACLPLRVLRVLRVSISPPAGVPPGRGIMGGPRTGGCARTSLTTG
jgi:hypothetical protein